MNLKIKQELIPIEEPLMDEEDAMKEARRDASIETLRFIRRGLRLVVQYKGNQTLALYAFMLAHDWGDEIGCETAVEIASKLFADPKKKAAATKAVLRFQESLGIPPSRGQRSTAGRVEMAKARKEQLK